MRTVASASNSKEALLRSASGWTSPSASIAGSSSQRPKEGAVDLGRGLKIGGAPCFADAYKNTQNKIKIRVGLVFGEELNSCMQVKVSEMFGNMFAMIVFDHEGAYGECRSCSM